MRYDVRLDIFGEIDNPEILNSIAELALETCEDARFAVDENPELEDMEAVVGYIDELAEDNKYLILFMEETRNEFEEIRGQLRQHNIGYRFLQGAASDMTFTESTVWRPGWEDERTISTEEENRPVIALEDLETAHEQGSGWVQTLINTARSASILHPNETIVLSAGLIDRWKMEFNSVADGNSPD